MKFESRNFAVCILVVANAILPIAIWIFATGFFPHKPFIPGVNNATSNYDYQKIESPFNKVIFMVVDALRSDFVYSEKSGFSFLQGLVRSGAAVPFTAHATSPTVTMPRVKAMTTGSIPSFVDLILNFAESDTTSTLSNQDSWPLQLSLRKAGKLAMYGDDTWLKLFPNLFSRSDGTTSFFVADFTEVDNNVTRHVDRELRDPSWDGIIMHYLGLDHIGHKSGPSSPNMIPKQTEMDGIVQRIFTAIETEEHLSSTLLVLCGDHGMNDAGNHGGSSPGETSPALVFVSPKLKAITSEVECPSPEPELSYQYFTTVEQSDVVPTLVGLLGLPIPLNNLGVFIPQFLRLWNTEHGLGLLRANAEQVLIILRRAYSAISFDEEPRQGSCKSAKTDADLLHCKWAAAKSSSNHEEASETTEKLLEFLRLAQEIMSTAASNYKISMLLSGSGLAALSTVLAVLSVFLSGATKRQNTLSSSSNLWLLCLSSMYGPMMLASSYVEEEHHYWNWISSAWLYWLFLTRYDNNQRSLPCLVVVSLAIDRVIRRWNQTGQKQAGSPDIAKTFLPMRQNYLWALVLLTYLYFWGYLVLHRRPNWPLLQVSLITFTVLVALAFKIAFTQEDAPELLLNIPFKSWSIMRVWGLSLVSQARITFIGLLGLTILNSLTGTTKRGSQQMYFGKAYWVDILSLFLITQTRATNIPLLLLFALQYRILDRCELGVGELSVSLIIFQHVAFFAYGGSNSISSIDLSNAYNGIADYNVLAVGILTFLSNWAGPIWWSANITLLLVRRMRQTWQPFEGHVRMLTVFVSASTLAMMVACTTLRAHLFIWTVFSPKFLFIIAWTLGHHICINIFLSTLLLRAHI